MFCLVIKQQSMRLDKLKRGIVSGNIYYLIRIPSFLYLLWGKLL